MVELRLRRFMVLISIVCGIYTGAWAQSEKIGLRMAPHPNQTVHMRMVQETEVDMSFVTNSTTAAEAMAPVKMATKTLVAITQKSGAANVNGQIEAELTYDEIT